MLLERELEGRTYIPERESKHKRVWTDKEPGMKEAVYGNRRRYRGVRGRLLSRRRSEYAERSFAHVCETDGARGTWLRGLENVAKRYCVAVAAHNLGVIMRALFGIGTPRGLQKAMAALLATAKSLLRQVFRHPTPVWNVCRHQEENVFLPSPNSGWTMMLPCLCANWALSTGW